MMTQELLVSAGSTLAAFVVIVLVSAVLRYLRALAASAEDARKRALAAMLVRAAEMVLGAGQGEAKYDWVMKAASKLRVPLAKAHVEAAVLMLQAAGWESDVKDVE